MYILIRAALSIVADGIKKIILDIAVAQANSRLTLLVGSLSS
jgi:hypothetical protein